MIELIVAAVILSPYIFIVVRAILDSRPSYWERRGQHVSDLADGQNLSEWSRRLSGRWP